MLRAVRCDKALEVRSVPALGLGVPHFSVDGIVHIPAARALCVGGALFVPLMPKHTSFDAWRAWAASVQTHLPAPLDAVLGPAVWIRLDEAGAGTYCDLDLQTWQAALERLHQPSHCAAQVRTLLGYERNKAAAKCKRVVGSAEGNAPANANAHASSATKAAPKAAKKPMKAEEESAEESSDGTYVESDSESDSRSESSEASCASETQSESEGSESSASCESASSESAESSESSDSDDGMPLTRTRGGKSAARRSCSKTL